MSQHLPEQRQSVRPTLPVLIGIVATLVVMAIIWFAVSWAVGSAGQDCASKPDKGVANENCR